MQSEEERRTFLKEARCRLAAIERLHADRLTTEDIPESDATWASAVLARRASMFLMAAGDLEPSAGLGSTV